MTSLNDVLYTSTHTKRVLNSFNSQTLFIINLEAVDNKWQHTIKPLHDRVIIRRIEDNVNQTAGGLYIPDSAKEKPQEGEVVAAGDGKYKEDGSRQALDVKEGDRVLFGKYSGSEIKIDGEELLIMREDEIFGIIERAGANAN